MRDTVNRVGSRDSPVAGNIANMRYMFVVALTVRPVNTGDEIVGHYIRSPVQPFANQSYPTEKLLNDDRAGNSD